MQFWLDFAHFLLLVGLSAGRQEVLYDLILPTEGLRMF
jgi:hypothetical protein